MKTDVAAGLGFGLGVTGAALATPVAIRVAIRAQFYDHPREYRQHTAPTPLLGGAAVLAGFLVAAVAVGGGMRGFPVVTACAVGMCLIGTVDDRIAVAPKWRLLAEGGAAIALYVAGLGWGTAAGGVVNLLLTVFWIVGLTNAFNLMDNMDGACSTVASVAAAGIGGLAVLKGDLAIAGLGFALAGACAAFLRWNLAARARIFLGDGGSMPIGFLVAALAMAIARRAPASNGGLLVGALLVGTPILDVTLVSLSRTRRGVTLVTGGRDHLTHRILLALGSARLVAGVLAVAQASLCGMAILGSQLGMGGVAVFAFIAFVAGVLAILVLDTQRWRPTGIAVREPSLELHPAEATVPVLADSA